MIIKSPIDLDLTINSGQTSQPPWIQNGDSFSNVVVTDGKPLIFNVRQSGDYLVFNLDDKRALSRLNYIFDLDFDLDKFYSYLNDHEELRDMSGFCRGLRLFLAPDPFECVISSICSANNSIKRWTKSVSEIKKNWGVRYGDYYTFPKSNVMSNIYLDEEDEFNLSDVQDICDCSNNLKNCGVGYRAPYMRRASELFTDEIDLCEIFEMSYDEAFETMLEVPGVGPKVADCILLYGFNFREAFPSDVWIKRIVSHLYFDGRDISVAKVRDFGMEEFGEYAGYVQLYMFHYARKSGLMAKLK
ncbi:3-methyladenine DNA glycosylase [Methanobrevibacter sp. YE315]|uniref:DNA glycosylase n=1 Tax=Methanobrevibacter sp. YE315 TaxID=1609968 RepID=UPI000764E865|nr:DNA glycosylase [Methanobrevibacter sp. YE315]AMD16679.1 3-methyladenine DNA glycosylase [Methanobrevibacter sp. YE315]